MNGWIVAIIVGIAGFLGFSAGWMLGIFVLAMSEDPHDVWDDEEW
jgi:hypothetical protein